MKKLLCILSLTLCLGLLAAPLAGAMDPPADSATPVLLVETESATLYSLIDEPLTLEELDAKLTSEIAAITGDAEVGEYYFQPVALHAYGDHYTVHKPGAAKLLVRFQNPELADYTMSIWNEQPVTIAEHALRIRQSVEEDYALDDLEYTLELFIETDPARMPDDFVYPIG